MQGKNLEKIKVVTRFSMSCEQDQSEHKTPKDQLISKANFKVFILTKQAKKIFLYFCPSLKKPLNSGRNKR